MEKDCAELFGAVFFFLHLNMQIFLVAFAFAKPGYSWFRLSPSLLRNAFGATTIPCHSLIISLYVNKGIDFVYYGLFRYAMLGL